MLYYYSRMIGVSNFMPIFMSVKTSQYQRVLYEREVLFVYAIITTGGKQYKVQEGDIIFVEKLGVEENEKVSFDVIAASTEDGIKTGDTGVTVEGTVLRNAKAKKVVVFKYKSKKGEKKKQGHRQPYSKVQITKIG